MPLTTFKTFARLALSLSLSAGAAARQSAPEPDVARGVEVYRSGDAEGSARLLREALRRDRENAEGWYYLGLALSGTGRVKEARGAFRKAVDLRPGNAAARAGLAYALLLGGKANEAEAEARRALAADARVADAHYVLGAALLLRDQEEEAVKAADAALSANPRLTPALVLKGNALANLYLEQYDGVAARHPGPARPGVEADPEAAARRREAFDAIRPTLAAAAAAFEDALKLEPNSPHAPDWREQAETLRVYSNGNHAAGPYRSSEVTEKAVILAKPHPSYTEELRSEGVSGTVRLRAVLSADGQVRHVFVLKSPDPRMSRLAVGAARKIKFRPAKKDGQSVSQSVVIEYGFHIY